MANTFKVVNFAAEPASSGTPYVVYTAASSTTTIILGLGEKDEEVFETMRVIRDIGVEIFNIGQYLQPTKKHLNVQRYVDPEIFELYKKFGEDIGFKVVESGPLVRSSYHADEQARQYRNEKLTDNIA